ncbi:MAG TPA: ABC transporter permease [Vicinamibacterales bacterium]|nr:ABC transporter permease [Vicinamibacterales bacterium]
MTHDDYRRRREIDEEVDAHLQARMDYLMARGATIDEARAEALRRFGDIEQGRRALYAQATLSRRRVDLVERWRQWSSDIRYVARGLSRKPSFTVGVVAIFALGLGINAAVFRVAYDLLLRPPAGVADAGHVRRVEALVQVGGPPTRATLFSYPDAEAVTSKGLADGALYTSTRVATTSEGREVTISEVDGRFFPLLGVTTSQGRGFDEREVQPGADIPVAILSHHLWSRLFPNERLTERATLTIAGRAYQIIGVLPRGFTGIELDPVDLWLPLGAANRGRGTVNGVIIPWYRSDMLRAVRVVGRVPAGLGDSALADRVTATFAGIDRERPGFPRTAELRPIVPIGDAAQAGASRQLVRRLIAVALIVLIIACANAMNLLLAHSLHRQQEVAVRLAMGASRARVVRLLVVQSVLLALTGGAVATIVGHWTAQGLWRVLFPDGRGVPSSIDPLTIAVTAALAIAVGLVAGLPPAWQTTRPDLIGTLRANRALGHRGSRITRAALVVGQTALSLTLLVMAGLLVLSLIRLGNVPLGFAPDGLVTASIVQSIPASETRLTVEELSAGLPPGSVAFATVAPFGATSVRDITVPGTTYTPESPMDQARYAEVSQNYFKVLGTRLVEGRGFTDADTSGSDAVVVVNETMKRNYWGARIPQGACILFDVCARVVGVVEDIRDAPGVPAPMRYYLALAQASRPASVVVVRTSAEATAAVVAQLRQSTPAGQRVVTDVIASRVSRALRPWRTAMILFLIIGSVGLLLAAVGLYSVVSYLASDRLPEFGVRVVLGATGADVVRLVLLDGLRLLAAGGAVGLAGAAIAARYLGALLFDVSPFEPVIYIVALASLAAAALMAMWPPAMRAARVNPVAALRAD